MVLNIVSGPRSPRDTPDSASASQPALHILLALGTGPKHRLHDHARHRRRSGRRIRLLPGTLYSTIKKLLADDIIEECDAPAGVESDDERRRATIRVTKLGRRLAEAERRGAWRSSSSSDACISVGEHVDAPRRLARPRCYRWVLGASPRAFRRSYLDDATDALVMMMADTRAKRGRLAASRLWMSAIADAVRTTQHERQDSGGSWFRGWFNDIRLAGRAIRRSPSYAFVVIATLTLAVGGVTAVFTLADPMLFRPLPLSGRRTHPACRRARRGHVRRVRDATSITTRSRTRRRVESVGGFRRTDRRRLSMTPTTTRLSSDTRSTTGYLSVLGVGPAFGRAFSAVEYAQAPDRTVTRISAANVPRS